MWIRNLRLFYASLAWVRFSRSSPRIHPDYLYSGGQRGLQDARHLIGKTLRRSNSTGTTLELNPKSEDKEFKKRRVGSAQNGDFL
jgi:hypothetical protein